MEKNPAQPEISSVRVKQVLKALAAVLHLPFLSAALEPPVKCAHSPSIRRDMGKVFESANKMTTRHSEHLSHSDFSRSTPSSQPATYSARYFT